MNGMNSLKRCSLEEIKKILSVGNGSFLATESNDRTVRFWITSLESKGEGETILGYLGFFSDVNHSKIKNHSNTGWDVFDLRKSI